jgi:hypothetical protein
VLDAVAGIPLDVVDLEAVLTGCVRSEDSAALSGQASQFGAMWMLLGPANGSQAYLRRASANEPWTLAATVRGARVASLRWRAEYGDRQPSGIPQTVRLLSVEDGKSPGGAFDLRLSLSQVEIDTPLGADVFTVMTPRTAKPMTLEELKRTGAFGGQ